MQKAFKEKDDENENVQSLNWDLLNCIQILEENENASYKGKDISEVQNKSRTLRLFYWELKMCYGLVLKSKPR